MDYFRVQIINHWFNRIKKNLTGPIPGFNLELFHSDNLIFISIAFDAYLSGEFQKGLIKNCIIEMFSDDKYKNLFNELKINNADFKSQLTKLKKELDKEPLIDMSSGSTREPSKMDNYDDLVNLFYNIIYRVRSNLIHGGKTMTLPRNQLLVESSYKILYYFLEKIIITENIQV
ncbi:MAG: hypothetical protein WC307_03125 [Candidatus Nanoarchaeia archaeon]|jgi:hypothetical protein